MPKSLSPKALIPARPKQYSSFSPTGEFPEAFGAHNAPKGQNDMDKQLRVLDRQRRRREDSFRRGQEREHWASVLHDTLRTPLKDMIASTPGVGLEDIDDTFSTHSGERSPPHSLHRPTSAATSYHSQSAAAMLLEGSVYIGNGTLTRPQSAAASFGGRIPSASVSIPGAAGSAPFLWNSSDMMNSTNSKGLRAFVRQAASGSEANDVVVPIESTYAAARTSTAAVTTTTLAATAASTSVAPAALSSSPSRYLSQRSGGGAAFTAAAGRPVSPASFRRPTTAQSTAAAAAVSSDPESDAVDPQQQQQQPPSVMRVAPSPSSTSFALADRVAASRPLSATPSYRRAVTPQLRDLLRLTSDESVEGKVLTNAPSCELLPYYATRIRALTAAAAQSVALETEFRSTASSPPPPPAACEVEAHPNATSGVVARNAAAASSSLPTSVKKRPASAMTQPTQQLKANTMALNAALLVAMRPSSHVSGGGGGDRGVLMAPQPAAVYPLRTVFLL